MLIKFDFNNMMTDFIGEQGISTQDIEAVKGVAEVAFDYFEDNPDTGAKLLGDIVISLERADEQAKAFGHSLRREIGFLTVHSMFHLLGYDHEEGLESVRMRKKDRVLSLTAYQYIVCQNVVCTVLDSLSSFFNTHFRFDFYS